MPMMVGLSRPDVAAARETVTWLAAALGARMERTVILVQVTFVLVAPQPVNPNFVVLGDEDRSVGILAQLTLEVLVRLDSVSPAAVTLAVLVLILVEESSGVAS